MVSQKSAMAMLALSSALVLSNCNKKDDDPAPVATSQENGFVKGKIKGTRQDSTAFEEAFEYKVAYGPEFMKKVDGSTSDYNLEVYRGINTLEDDPNRIGFKIMIANRDQSPTGEFKNFNFGFTKAITDGKLFYARTQPVFEETEKFLPMSRANNTTYKLKNFGVSVEYVTNEDGYLYRFMDADGNAVYFENLYSNNEYDMQKGKYIHYGNFAYIITKAGKKITTSATYDNLQIVSGDTYHFEFCKISMNAQTGIVTRTSFSEKVTVPADNQEIKNLKYDAKSGLVTFDFVVKVNALRGLGDSYETLNTTNNAFEISGSVSTTAYSEVVMRKSAE